MRQSIAAAILFGTLAFACPKVWAQQGLPEGAEAVAEYKLLPLIIYPQFTIDSLESSGDLKLKPAGPLSASPFSMGVSEGYYLLLPGMAQWGRPARAICRTQIEEITASGGVSGKVDPKAVETLQKGDVVAAVRISGMATQFMRDLPGVISILGVEEEEEKKKASPNLLTGLLDARERARLAQSINNLKQIGLALHNFEAAWTNFPPAIVYGPDGKPWHSWRVLILPFLEEQALYNEYRFNEPWDSSHNKKLSEKAPAVYRDAAYRAENPSVTHYAALVGPGTVFPAEGSRLTDVSDPSKLDGLFKGLGIQDITDGTSNSIGIAPVSPERAIPWTKPEDISVTDSFPGLGQPGGIAVPYKLEGKKVAPILFLDGSVRPITDAIEPGVLRALLTIRGGEPIDSDSIPTISVTGFAPRSPSERPVLKLFRLNGRVMAELK